MPNQNPRYNLKDRLEMLPKKHYARVVKGIYKQAGVGQRAFYYSLENGPNMRMLNAITDVLGCSIANVVDENHQFDQKMINWELIESLEEKSSKVAA